MSPLNPMSFLTASKCLNIISQFSKKSNSFFSLQRKLISHSREPLLYTLCFTKTNLIALPAVRLYWLDWLPAKGLPPVRTGVTGLLPQACYQTTGGALKSEPQLKSRAVLRFFSCQESPSGRPYEDHWRRSYEQPFKHMKNSPGNGGFRIAVIPAQVGAFKRR